MAQLHERYDDDDDDDDDGDDDAGELPRRKHTTFRKGRKFEINNGNLLKKKNISCLTLASSFVWGS